MDRGKTTLLMVAAGLLKPGRGIVLLDDKPIKEELLKARKRIGFVLQDLNDQLFNLTVYGEIALTVRQHALTEEEINRKVMETASRFRLTDLLERPPYKLSMEEKHRVTLASVLIHSPGNSNAG